MREDKLCIFFSLTSVLGIKIWGNLDLYLCSSAFCNHASSPLRCFELGFFWQWIMHATWFTISLLSVPSLELFCLSFSHYKFQGTLYYFTSPGNICFALFMLVFKNYSFRLLSTWWSTDSWGAGYQDESKGMHGTRNSSNNDRGIFLVLLVFFIILMLN